MNLKLYNYIIKIETLFIMLLKNLSLPKGLCVNNDENEKSIDDIPQTSSMTFKIIDNFVFDGKLSPIFGFFQLAHNGSGMKRRAFRST